MSPHSTKAKTQEHKAKNTMISSWRSKRRAGRRAVNKHHADEISGCGMELITIPNHFRCPISLDLMKDPVTLSTGITYDRESIETWIESGNNTCPITNQVLRTLEPIPNHTIRKMIQEWCVEKRSFGVERIPTPRIPVSAIQVSEILSKITLAYGREDRFGCEELVRKIKNLAKESERNKRCIVSNGTASVLAAALEAFSKASFDENSSVLEELLSSLTWIIDGEAKSYLGSSTSSLHCMVWFLTSGNLTARRNAVSVLKEVLYHDQTRASSLHKIEGTKEALVKLVREPICPTTTRASLIVIFYMISSSDNMKIIAKFVELGLISVLIELLVDSDRNMYEKALAVLDKICICEEGREMACDNALTIPVLVKKILKVSDLATELSVSVLWKLCKSEEREDGGGVVEALQVGAFQKLLLVLQVGCGERTKEKATELLKLLNHYRGRVECIESIDFKDLKRPF